MDERRAEQALADQAGAPRTTGAGVFLVKDDLLVDGQPAAARPGRPTDAGPPAGGEFPFPRHSLLDEHVLVARSPAEPELSELAGEMLVHPGSDLVAKRGIGVAVAQLHDVLRTGRPLVIDRSDRRYLTPRQIRS